MNIFLDLDGTLIDSKIRMYKLFNAIVVDSDLKFENYWARKFSGMDHEKILKLEFGFSHENFLDFEKKWMAQIESSSYLGLDNLFSGVQEWLSEKSQNHKLYLVTARQNTERTNLQLKGFGIFDYFSKILITEQKKSKKELIEDSGIICSSADWFIGDTGHDINTGKSLGLKTCAVLSGFMSQAKLICYQPDLILNNLIDFE